MNLIRALAEHYPEWRTYHKTAIEAAVEIGLLEEDVLAEMEVPELNFNEVHNE
jgi:hypothetical protein